MTTTTVFASTTDGAIASSNATYATAANGSGLSAGSGASTNIVGQTTSVYNIRQLFFEFDTSGVPDGDKVSNVVFSLEGVTDNSTIDIDMVVLDYDWSGSGLTTAEWRTPAQPQALNQLATFNTSGFSTSYMDFTSAGAVFNSSINKT